MTRLDEDEVDIIKVAVPKGSELWNVIYRTLQNTSAGRLLNNTVIIDMADAIEKSLGHDRFSGDRVSDFVGPDASLLSAVQDLLDWTPELGYSEKFAKFAVKDYDSSFYFGQTAEEYQELIDGSEGPIPFFSQAIYYPVLGGKQDGRGLAYRISELRKAAGLDD